MMRGMKFLSVLFILSLALTLSTCSQDFYADLPCVTNDDCPRGYHCEADSTGKMVCMKGETEQIAGITVTPEEINFGDVQVRDKSGQEISITNKSLSKAKINIALDFANKSDELSLEKKTISINYNETQKVKVFYSPKKVGSLAQNQVNIFLVAGGKSTKVKNILLYGRGIDPTIVATPDTIDFGKLYPGNKSELKSITISNSTGGDLKITNIYIDEGLGTDAGGPEIAEFELSELPTFPAPIKEKGAFIEIKVQFKPKKAGVKQANVIIENTDIDSPKLVVILKGEGATCEPDYYDINGKPEDGCEYHCAPKLKGVDICDGEDNDCDGEIDNGLPDDVCPLKDKAKKHVASTACIEKNGDKVCVIAECEPNYWDNNGLYDDGCEAECVKSNNGIEICDGVDNDCNGKTDELNANTMCPPAFNTSEANCVQGHCEYVCNYGYGNCNDNWEDGCETDVKNNSQHCGKCNSPCQPPNAIGMCSDMVCKVVSCQQGYYDINKDPSDGCEYHCTPDGQERCDGKDNDCDGQTDNADIKILCPTDIHTTFQCDGSNGCKISSCASNWYDINGVVADGCECQAYSSIQGGDSCLSATDLGSFSNKTQSYSIQTNLLPVGKSAWYKATFVDDVNEDITYGDNFRISIKIISNPQRQYLLDVFEIDCSTSPKWNTFLNCDSQEYSFYTDFRGGSGPDGKPLGEKPCYESGNVENKNICKNNTMPVYFRIYRDSNVTPTCENAVVQIDFTR
ncbi:MAG: choice-of-anchor D domain-containing protein [Myxococcota bacterium]